MGNTYKIKRFYHNIDQCPGVFQFIITQIDYILLIFITFYIYIVLPLLARYSKVLSEAISLQDLIGYRVLSQ